MKAIRLGLLSLTILLATTEPKAVNLPRPPCDLDPEPPYAELNSPAAISFWNGGDIDSRWIPPGCTAWRPSKYRILIALAARFRHSGGVEDLLARFATVSAWRSIKYWSVTDNAWRFLVTDAAALNGPEVSLRRRDFTEEEMETGGDYFVSQDDSRSTGAVVYRMQVLERTPSRLVIRMENMSPVKALFVTLFDPGDLQSVYFLDRLEQDIWGYYSLGGTREGANPLTAGHKDSYRHRATALYRYFAGLPTEAALPLGR